MGERFAHIPRMRNSDECKDAVQEVRKKGKNKGENKRAKFLVNFKSESSTNMVQLKTQRVEIFQDFIY